MPGTGSVTEDLDRIAERYRFPSCSGRGERVAIVEPHGGYLDADLRAVLGTSSRHGSVTAHPVEAAPDGLPLRGTNSPLDEATIVKVIDDLERDGDAARVAKEYAADAVWKEFLATLEVTLDVQIVARLVPDAAIDVWFTPTHLAGLAAGIDRAVESGATAVSISWGQSERSCVTSGRRNVELVEAALRRAVAAGITVCCASGDYGSLNELVPGDGLVQVNYPASSPSALACGATMTSTPPTEVVWNAVEYGFHHASGGGISGLFARPGFQSGLPDLGMASVWTAPGTEPEFVGRSLPDLALNAGPYPIVLGGRDLAVSGTSASAPMMAALLARIAETTGASPGWIVERIYAAGGRGCTDVVKGDDALHGARRVFSAAPGWDACTGWGTPLGDELTALLRPGTADGT